MKDACPFDVAKFEGEVRVNCLWVFWQKWALGVPTNRFPLVWENFSNGKWLKMASEKSVHVPVFRAEMLVTLYALQVRAIDISSRHKLISIHFAFDPGSLSITGGWRKCGMLLIFCQTVVLVCPLILQEEQKARVKELAVARFHKKTPNWPTCNGKPVHVHECSRETRWSFDSAYHCRQLDRGSVWVLLPKQDILMLKFMAILNLVVLFPHSQRIT